MAPATAQSPAPSIAPESPPEAAPQTIGTISVEGNVYTDSTRILRTFEVIPGSRFSADAIRRGVRKLIALGLFDDVRPIRHEHDGVVDLVLVVKERPRIDSIRFEGNQKRETSELEKKLFLRVGETYSPTAAQTQVDSLLQYYRDEGFGRAKVSFAPDTVAGKNAIALRFVVVEGEKVRITRIEFAGRTAFAEKRLRKAMKTKQKGFFGGGDLKDEAFTEDREKLEAYYHDNGYRDMRAVDFQVKPGDEPRHLTLVVTLDEGRLYFMGSTVWSGNHAVDSTSLAKLWQPKAGEKYSHARIERATGAAYAEYAEHGYLYLNVEPRETVRDSLVDIEFAVTEGQPSNIRLVSVIGNKGTREKVIRREIDIHEGDRFRRSALMRSRDDVMRLGIFEDVQPDFTPADSSDVDLIFRIKEKQVGTASAGAGYTNESGLTGFLELGHNNVLGNGQSLQLHLERGGRRSDYSLSFTEPWFRDTPTLVGFSAFNTDRQLDFYNEKRRGASLRLGRPLPWPDYSRGSIAYSLEDVTLSLTDADPTTAAAFQGVTLDRPVLTSSFNVGFSRNSTDHPFYPTRGTRFTVNSEFAGGPFGGAINFHKSRFEERIYVRSLLKGVTTMLKARVGIMGEYADQNLSAPRYEFFRMGGGNTADPLRGYLDYQVVPDGNVTLVPASNTTILVGGYPVVIPDRSSKVRYPGGRAMLFYSTEQQFPIVAPLRGVLFFDAGNVWNYARDVRPFDLKLGAGLGFRMEIPLLGNIGFDYGYGFNRDDGARWQGHFLLGNVGF